MHFTVLWHSITWQYLPADGSSDPRRIDALAAQAMPTARSCTTLSLPNSGPAPKPRTWYSAVGRWLGVL